MAIKTVRLTIRSKMSGTGSIHDVASDMHDRTICIPEGGYAVVVAAYYGYNVYSSHRTAAKAIQAAKTRWQKYSYVIMDTTGDMYHIDNNDELVRA